MYIPEKVWKSGAGIVPDGQEFVGEGVRLYGELRGLMRNSGMLKCKIALCAACFFCFFLFLWANRKYCKIGAIQEQL